MNRFHSKSVLIIKTSMLISNAFIISFLINMYSAYSKKMMHFIFIYFVFFIFLILCKVTPRLKNLNKTSKLSSKTRHESSLLDLVCRNSIDLIYNNVYYLCWLDLHFTNLQFWSPILAQCVIDHTIINATIRYGTHLNISQ